ncbi:hypothetical protein GS568_00420 [Escherichia coli]|nr:hypothetical protein [Escherichia coli]
MNLRDYVGRIRRSRRIRHEQSAFCQQSDPLLFEEGNDHSATFFFAARFALVAAAIFCVFADGFFAFLASFFAAFGFGFFSPRKALSGSKFTFLPT